jgi:dienelactone hydrolase
MSFAMQKSRGCLKTKLLLISVSAILVSVPTLIFGQSRPAMLAGTLGQSLQTPEVSAEELRQYLFQRSPKPPHPTSAEQWAIEAARLRKHLLADVIFHGWPPAWVGGSPKFEDLGVFYSGDGYRMRKLRYEIVPGFQSTAILYEPQNLKPRTPAVLNVNGHDYEVGKASEYKQKRCINLAKQGMLALSLEWLSCGELNHPENRHEFGSHLDLVGANGVGLFYLAMRRGLDYLYDHPSVDRSRIAVTGLSGGGWQTILLSALDERVRVAIPVAGYGAFMSKLERKSDYGDIEQIPSDFHMQADYSHLTAMRAPRPTLLIYDAEDDCCYRASLVKPDVYDSIKPFFSLFHREDAFAWHENLDPGTHNYQLDNRLQAYRFLSIHFGMPIIEHEIPVDGEIKSYEELMVGLPQDNLTILGLAKKMAQSNNRAPIPSSPDSRAQWVGPQRTKLKHLVRYEPVDVEHAWALGSTDHTGIETRSYRFRFTNGLSATGIWIKTTTSPATSPATLILNDNGKKAAAEEASDRLNRGEQVLVVNLLFTEDASPNAYDRETYVLMLATIGQRAIGIEAAQLIALGQWLQNTSGSRHIRLESDGIRSQIIGLIASGIGPDLFSPVVIRDGMRSFQYLLDKPVPYQSAPDLFCLDLYKEFDVDYLAALNASAPVITVSAVPSPVISTNLK